MKNIKTEVRYQYLRPAQVVEIRTKCPVVYIPIGILEWHGVHNPLGADALQAEHLAALCAERGGGLAFPPLYYGEVRTERLVEATSLDNKEISELMGLDYENFQPEHFIYSEAEQYENYQRLLAHILNQAETLGFEVAVIIAGHYPLIDQAKAAALLHNKRVRRAGRMLAWATGDYLHLLDKYNFVGDHGGGWETSHCMAIDQKLVDLSLLPPKGEKIVGAGGGLLPQDASADFGHKIFEEAADIIINEALHRLNNKEIYKRHGMSMSEGLWKS